MKLIFNIDDKVELALFSTKIKNIGKIAYPYAPNFNIKNLPASLLEDSSDSYFFIEIKVSDIEILSLNLGNPINIIIQHENKQYEIKNLFLSKIVKNIGSEIKAGLYFNNKIEQKKSEINESSYDLINRENLKTNLTAITYSVDKEFNKGSRKIIEHIVPHLIKDLEQQNKALRKINEEIEYVNANYSEIFK